ncbi:MAG: peptidoglycan DD-metalloendopeptidase family protein [Turicibacter sp.]|nr:peptidoglycan DD-metalloendopeptidase family protein [Turicibacter sp.]
MSKRIGTVLSLIVAFSLTQQISFTAKAATTCSTKAECNAIISEAQSQISDLKGKEAAVQEEIDIVEGNMGTTIQKISETENAISEFEKKITVKENEIKNSENEINKLENEIKELKDVVAERMRVSQRLSRANTILQVLSESENLVDLIRRLRVVNHFAESDAESMEKLSLLVSQQQAMLATLKVQKQELASNKADLERERQTLTAYQEQLEQQKEELAQQMQELESERLSAAEILEIAEEQKKILEQTPPPVISNGSSSGSSSSGGVVSGTGFMIPLATGYVSCEFMCYPNHTGIDLANYGDTSTPVYAAQAGTVIRAGWHSAYGNHVMITHNVNGQVLTTVYAHMHSAPYVSVGQQVSRGTQLGTMGNTGNSFGAHLHFEVYEGYYNYPYAVNPRKYVSFPSSW